MNTTACSPTWCPGCGDFAIWAAFKKAASEQKWDNSNSVVVAGIGCHGHIVNFMRMTAFEGLHGRALPVASAVKMANHKLNVFVFSGDGDCFGEGGNHFIHTARRNHDITMFLHDNQIYALTTGQTSPLSHEGFKTKSSPTGAIDKPLNPLAMAITAGATFVARAYTSDLAKLTEIMIKANEHKGFAVIDILQPCVTFNHVNTHEYYQEHTYYLGSDYNPRDKMQAYIKAQEWGPKQIPLGIFYVEERPTYESYFPQISEKALVEVEPVKRDLSEVFKKFS